MGFSKAEKSRLVKSKKKLGHEAHPSINEQDTYTTSAKSETHGEACVRIVNRSLVGRSQNSKGEKEMAKSSKDERILRGILFDEDRPVSLVELGDEDEGFFDSALCGKIDRALDRIMHAMEDDSDALKSMRKLLYAYEGSHYPDFDPDHLPKDVLIRVVINNVLLAVCGWSLPTLMADEFPGEEAKDEEGHGEKQDG